MIELDGFEPGAVPDHYNRVSHYYRAQWGEHIHHGYWDRPDDPPARAQSNLIEHLAAFARIPRGGYVLDAGCGIGGSAFWLARNLECTVLGLTNSRVQARMAERRARHRKLNGQVRFEVTDAERLDLPAHCFDAVWIVESSEHFQDKARFFERCYRALKPGGVLALCAWLAGEALGSSGRMLVQRICRGMLCPSLGTLGDHVQWLTSAGFQRVRADDCTRQVERTWEHCLGLLRSPSVQVLLRIADPRTRAFTDSFADMKRAYAEGAMAYGMFTGKKPR